VGGSGNRRAGGRRCYQHPWYPALTALPPASRAPPAALFGRKNGLDGATSFLLSPSHLPLQLSLHSPSPSLSPPTPLQLLPHTLPRSGLLFLPGASFKSTIDAVGCSDEESLSPAARCRWGPRLNPRPVLHQGITMNSGTAERRRKSSSVLRETALSPGPKELRLFYLSTPGWTGSERHTDVGTAGSAGRRAWDRSREEAGMRWGVGGLGIASRAGKPAGGVV